MLLTIEANLLPKGPAHGFWVLQLSRLIDMVYNKRVSTSNGTLASQVSELLSEVGSCLCSIIWRKVWQTSVRNGMTLDILQKLLLSFCQSLRTIKL